MKHLVLLILFACTTAFCQAQYTLYVKNKTGMTLDIGGQMAPPSATCDPDPGDLVIFGNLAIPPGDGTSFFIPSGMEVFRLGGSQTGAGTPSGWTKGGSPCWPTPTCEIGGSLTVIYLSCDAVEIW